MAKLTKDQNPWGVTIRSVWEAKQLNRQGRTFTIKKIVDESGEYFAEGLYDKSGKKTRINLQNFIKYQRVS
jgi:predicted metal-dependent HD superfamily phosphohydrolase